MLILVGFTDHHWYQNFKRNFWTMTQNLLSAVVHIYICVRMSIWFVRVMVLGIYNCKSFLVLSPNHSLPSFAWFSFCLFSLNQIGICTWDIQIFVDPFYSVGLSWHFNIHLKNGINTFFLTSSIHFTLHTFESKMIGKNERIAHNFMMPKLMF